MKNTVKIFGGGIFPIGFSDRKGEDQQLDEAINEYAKKNNLNPIDVIPLHIFSGSGSGSVMVIFEPE